MEKFKSEISSNKISLTILSVFVFLRFALFLPLESLTGSDRIDSDMEIRFHHIVFYILLLIFSLVFSFLIHEIYNKNKDMMFLPCVFICFDVFLFMSQNTLIHTFVTLVWMLYFTISLKASIKREFIVLPILSFITVLLDPLTVVSYVLLVCLIYFILSNRKNIKEFIRFFVIEILISAGAFALNYLLRHKFSELNLFISEYAEADYSFNWKNRIYIILSFVPIYIFMRIFVGMLSSDVNKTKNKKAETLFLSGAKIFAVVAVLLINFIFALWQQDPSAFSSVILVLSCSLIAFILNDNINAKNVLRKIYTYIQNNKFIFILIFLTLYVLQITILYRLNFCLFNYASSYI